MESNGNRTIDEIRAMEDAILDMAAMNGGRYGHYISKWCRRHAEIIDALRHANGKPCGVVCRYMDAEVIYFGSLAQ